jgi:hypothetical protein
MNAVLTHSSIIAVENPLQPRVSRGADIAIPVSSSDASLKNSEPSGRTQAIANARCGWAFYELAKTVIARFGNASASGL